MKRAWLKCGVAALAGVVCLLFGGIGVAANGEALPVVSYGLGVLSAATDVAVSAPVGNDVPFSAEVFARGLNLSQVDYITIKTLPEVAAGELLLGSSRVAAGQTISGENLLYLAFSPATEDAMQASFTFTANGGATPLICNVYLINEINYTPTVSMAAGLSLQAATYQDSPAYGCLSAYDPDGDELTFEVVSYPQNGSLQLTNRKTGEYVYKPNASYVGSDSFSYVARDRYGNYSASATVTVKVAKPETSIQYVDMINSPYHNDAKLLTEAGVMSGTQMGNQYYFYPQATVSRVEFLVMAMNAVGITDVPACEATVFADDAEIPKAMKGYVATAYELGYISGTLSEGKLCFLPEEAITRAEAAVMLSNLVGLCEVPVTPTFADGSEIPVWAKESIYSLNAAGILTGQGGYITPTSQITRGQTAEILANVMEYVG